MISKDGGFREKNRAIYRRAIVFFAIDKSNMGSVDAVKAFVERATSFNGVAFHCVESNVAKRSSRQVYIREMQASAAIRHQNLLKSRMGAKYDQLTLHARTAEPAQKH